MMPPNHHYISYRRMLIAPDSPLNRAPSTGRHFRAYYETPMTIASGSPLGPGGQLHPTERQLWRPRHYHYQAALD